jgi:hypothetical protein
VRAESAFGVNRRCPEKTATSEFDPKRQTNASVADRLHNAYRRRSLAQGTPMTDREKILIALREKPLKAFEIMKRVNIKHQDCQSLF